MLTFAAIISTAGFIAPEWAGPANTILLIVLTIATGKLKRKADQIHSDVSSAAAAALSAAQAAAYAAESAQDTARISKEIGGTFRRLELDPRSE